jgi:hypothetical protein
LRWAEARWRKPDSTRHALRLPRRPDVCKAEVAVRETLAWRRGGVAGGLELRLCTFSA